MGILKSFSFAWQGLIYVIKFERNARVHLVFAILALLCAFLLRVSDIEMAAIFFAIILVFFAEVVNTALEKTLDLIDRNHNEQIRIVKDMAAGAVLVTATGATVIGLVIFVPHLARLW